MTARARGATLIVGLILLSIATLLALASASTARIETRLAQNGRFRENAIRAASAGLELAIHRVVNAPDPTAVPHALNASLPGSVDRFETSTRFVGFELALPQESATRVVGAHFEIVSTGHSARRSVDRQRESVMLVIASPDAVPLGCDPPRIRCFRAGDLVRTGWQRTAVHPP
jgi:Tfp pilus assembly protein PilX